MAEIPFEQVSDEEKSMESTNEHLPPEMLLKIFQHYMKTEGPLKFLRDIQPVCKLWRDLSEVGLLWESVSWKSMSCNLDHLMKLSKRGFFASTRNLDLSCYGSGLNAENLLEIFQHCNNVESLDFSINEVITETIVQTIAEKFHRMKKFVLWDNVSLNSDGNLWFEPINIFDPIFESCGQTLKYLELRCSFCSEDMFISKIAECCPCLEELRIKHVPDIDTVKGARFPIGEIMNGCPKLQVLKMADCSLEIHSTKAFEGLKDLKHFEASFCDFMGLDVSEILKNSTELEYIEFFGCRNKKLVRMCEIPSEKLKYLRLLHDGENVEYLQKAVRKWRRTLINCVFLIDGIYPCNMTSVVKAFLEDNPNPVIEEFVIMEHEVDLHVVKTLVRVCENLNEATFYTDSGHCLTGDREDLLQQLQNL